jgi:hypothetical protein
MAENPIPDDIDGQMALAEDMADGLNQYELVLLIGQNTEARMRASLDGFRVANLAYRDARDLKKTRTAQQRVADSNGKAYIFAAVGVLKNFLGQTWDEGWELAGFVNGSIAVPGKMAERQTLLQSLRDYFASHAAQENAPLNVTSAQAGTLFTALSAARSAVNAQLTAVGVAKGTRESTRRALELRQRGLIDELSQLLDPLDPRWLAFGLNMPGADETPEPPDNVQLMPLPAPGDLFVDFDDVPNADHYRIFKQVVGVDADFIAAATVTDSDGTLSGLPPGSTVRVRVTAVRGSLESQPSATVEIVMPVTP